MDSNLILSGRLMATLIFTFSILLGVPAHAAATHHRHGLSLAPAGLVAVIAKTQAKGAAHNPAYAIAKNGCALLRAGPKGQDFSGCFTQTGPAFALGKNKINLHLVAWGQKGNLHPVSLHRANPKANRIEYRGKNVSEWWRVLPMGYEQGFAINKAPQGHGSIVLQLKTNRAPTIHHDTLAWGKLHYGKLRVIDADGRILPSRLRAKGKTITLAFDSHKARFPVTVDPMVWVQQLVTASDGQTDDFFGESVALSSDGSTALVGARGNVAAYVFTESGHTWTQTAKLSGVAAPGVEFGWSVALSADGSVALIGDPGFNSYQGVAYIFVEPAAGWTNTATPTATLSDSSGVAGDEFGNSLALSDDGATALIGVWGRTVAGNTAQGIAYIYSMPAAGWATTSTPTATLTASDGLASDNFGYTVALSRDGSTALVDAPGKTVGGNKWQGAAYVYSKPGTGWATATQTAELTASDGAASDFFGDGSLALSGDGSIALIGADQKNTNQGAAYIYTMPASGGWVSTSAYTAEITAVDGASYSYFGSAVALSGDGSLALIGAYGDTSAPPEAYFYAEPAGGWATTSGYTTWFMPYDQSVLTDIGDAFAKCVALSSDGTKALLGAAYDLASPNAQGEAYFVTNENLSTSASAPTGVLASGQYDSQYTVSNNGSAASAGIQVQLQLPTGANYVSTSATQGSCSYDSSAAIATCNLGSIPAGAAATAKLTTTATATSGTQIFNYAQLYNGTPNLSSTTTTTVAQTPAISGVNDVTVTSPNPGTESFTVSGTGTLTVSATSSNTTLLPNANITGASSCTAAGNCALTLTPASGQTGSATVTVNLADGYGQTGSATFLFTVNAAGASTAPTISGLTGVTTTEGKAGTESFTIGGTGTLTVSATSNDQALLPNANISGASSCTASGSCTLTLTPASGQTGSAIVTMTVTDSNGVSSTGTFMVTVNTSSTSGSGGGGAFGLWSLVGLLGLVGFARRTARRTGRTRECD